MKEEVKIRFAREEKKGAVLKVIGVGGAGGNAVNRMIDAGLQGVEFYAVNTDIQDLASIKPPAVTLQIGEKITRGLGAGSNHQLGMEAALENNESILDILDGANMVFITAGMGGGTGTGASQVIANHASSAGILTVAVVTKPFDFEGEIRSQSAAEGLKMLVDVVDALIVIPNEKLFELDESLSLKDAYGKADEVLLQAVKGISDIINKKGYQNVDFADVRTAMHTKGMTLMGTGEAQGENRAEEATKKALHSPLLDDISINGATGILYNITASSGLGLKEVKIVADLIKENVARDAKIKFGVVEDEHMGDRLTVTIIATGFEQTGKRANGEMNKRRRLYRQPEHGDRMNAPSVQTPPVTAKSPEVKKEEEKPAMSVKEKRREYVFQTDNTPFTLSDISESYVNEGGRPNLTSDPDHLPDDEDDFLEVPVFKRSKLTSRE